MLLIIVINTLLFTCLSKSSLSCQQTIHNAAARFFNLHKWPLLFYLIYTLWIQFKILVQTFRALHEQVMWCRPSTAELNWLTVEICSPWLSLWFTHQTEDKWWSGLSVCRSQATEWSPARVGWIRLFKSKPKSRLSWVMSACALFCFSIHFVSLVSEILCTYISKCPWTTLNSPTSVISKNKLNISQKVALDKSGCICLKSLRSKRQHFNTVEYNGHNGHNIWHKIHTNTPFRLYLDPKHNSFAFIRLLSYKATFIFEHKILNEDFFFLFLKQVQYRTFSKEEKMHTPPVKEQSNGWTFG